MQKKFKYFDKAEGRFVDGKLVGIKFYADIDKKYSVDSMNEQVAQALADMAVTFGLPSTAFNRVYSKYRLIRPGDKMSATSYCLGKYRYDAPDGFRRCGAVIEDLNLEQKYYKDKNATGEKLPDAK